MTFWQAIFLGILQGVTEFLPVSSSGHLVIVPFLLNWPAPSLQMDVMLHVGTTLAIVVYFWKDLLHLAQAALQSLQQRSLADPEARLAWLLALSTIPAVLAGLFLKDTVEHWFSAPKTAAGFLLVTAASLVFAEYFGKKEHTLDTLPWTHALYIGIAQALAIAPGISRSGATIATGVALQYRREDATRFSFLLGIPIIFGGGVYQILQMSDGSVESLSWGLLTCGLLMAAVSGYLCIAGLLALVRKQGLWPFAIYCTTFALLVLTGILQ